MRKVSWLRRELTRNTCQFAGRVAGRSGVCWTTNLDMIISVGYRVKSHVATRFRIWATQRLREFIIKGFVLDDERLKNPDQPFDYFEELLRRHPPIDDPAE